MSVEAAVEVEAVGDVDEVEVTGVADIDDVDVSVGSALGVELRVGVGVGATGAG